MFISRYHHIRYATTLSDIPEPLKMVLALLIMAIYARLGTAGTSWVCTDQKQHKDWERIKCFPAELVSNPKSRYF